MLEMSEKIQVAISIFVTSGAIAALVAIFHHCADTSVRYTGKEYRFLVWLAIVCGILATLYVFLLPLAAICIPIGMFIIGIIVYKKTHR